MADGAVDQGETDEEKLERQHFQKVVGAFMSYKWVKWILGL